MQIVFKTMDINIIFYGFPLVLIIMGLVQIAKKFVDARYTPVVAIVVGMILASLATYNYWTPESLFKGIVAGLVSSGLWDFGKKSLLGK